MLVFAFLVMFIVLFPCLLMGLRFDMTVTGVGNIYCPAAGAIWLILMVIGMVRRTKAIKNGKDRVIPEREERRNILFVTVVVAVLWFVSYVIFSPSGLCDVTRENAGLMMAYNEIYEYSAFTGAPMDAGQPIFNKVQLMPVFYAVVMRFTGLPLWLWTGFVIPASVLAFNAIVIYRLSGVIYHNDHKRRFVLLAAYYLVLIAGTYLPTIGIPVTVGYPLLRMGYSGWAVCYGVILPYILLLLAEKKYMVALTVMIPIPGLVRLDRFFYLALDPKNTIESIGTAGKLVFLYVIALVVLYYMRAKDKERTPWFVLFLPGLTIARAVERLTGLMKERKERIVFAVGTLAVILSACQFVPYKDIEGGVFRSVSDPSEYKKADSIMPEDAKILADPEFMAKIRIYDPESEVIYSRAIGDGLLAGLDFEETPEDYDEYSIVAEHYGTYNCAYRYYDIPGVKPVKEVFSAAVEDGVNVVAFPGVNLEAYAISALEATGFRHAGTAAGREIYVR